MESKRITGSILGKLEVSTGAGSGSGWRISPLFSTVRSLIAKILVRLWTFGREPVGDSFREPVGISFREPVRDSFLEV